MSELKVLREQYELGALRLLRVEKIPDDAEVEESRHTIMRMTQDNEPVFFWARRVYRTRDNREYVEVTFTTPIKRGRETPVMIPPGIYLVQTKRE